MTAMVHHNVIIPIMATTNMVMPLVDEDRPRCYMCGKMFADLDALREHIKEQHGSMQVPQGREPAPGDVTVF